MPEQESQPDVNKQIREAGGNQMLQTGSCQNQPWLPARCDTSGREIRSATVTTRQRSPAAMILLDRLKSSTIDDLTLSCPPISMIGLAAEQHHLSH